MPGGGGPEVASHEGPVRGHTFRPGHVLVGGLGRRAVLGRILQRLQLVVGHRGDGIFLIAVAIEVITCEPHAPDAQVGPAVVLGIELRRLAGLHLPHLLLPALVILAVIGDAQAGGAGVVPVGEQHGERAIAGRQFERGREALALWLRALQHIGRAGAPWFKFLGAVDIVADGDGGPRAALLPFGRVGRGPAVAACEAPVLVGAGELAVALALHHDVLAHPQHHHVHDAVTVDVDGIGAGHGVELEAALLLLELQCAAAGALVHVESRRFLATGDQHVLEAIAVAVEGSHPAAHHVLPLTGVDAVDAGGLRLLDEGGDDGTVTGEGMASEEQ